MLDKLKGTSSKVRSRLYAGAALVAAAILGVAGIGFGVDLMDRRSAVIEEDRAFCRSAHAGSPTDIEACLRIRAEDRWSRIWDNG